MSERFGRRLRPEEQMMMPGGAPAGAQGIPRNIVPGTPGEAPEGEIRAVRDGEAEEAYRMGARMGAQALAQDAGITGGGQIQPGGVTKERLIEAERLLMEYKKGKASVERRIIIL